MIKLMQLNTGAVVRIRLDLEKYLNVDPNMRNRSIRFDVTISETPRHNQPILTFRNPTPYILEFNQTNPFSGKVEDVYLTLEDHLTDDRLVFIRKIMYLKYPFIKNRAVSLELLEKIIERGPEKTLTEERQSVTLISDILHNTGVIWPNQHYMILCAEWGFGITGTMGLVEIIRRKSNVDVCQISKSKLHKLVIDFLTKDEKKALSQPKEIVERYIPGTANVVQDYYFDKNALPKHRLKKLIAHVLKNKNRILGRNYIDFNYHAVRSFESQSFGVTLPLI